MRTTWIRDGNKRMFQGDLFLQNPETRRIPVSVIGRVVMFSPNITHIYHTDPEKNFHGLPAFVIHASFDIVADALEKVKDGIIEITETPPDYKYEMENVMRLEC